MWRSWLKKHQNILVESNSPEWLVKIADFGISKRAQEGETDFRTHVGTHGYVAPEVLGFFSDNAQSVPYSVSVDIWAIGIVAAELLLKRLPFLDICELTRYLDGSKQLDIGADFSHSCREFVRELLTPNPVTRPTAGSARNHLWVTAGIPPVDTEES
jgi:serine/threonine protein kinase